MSATTCTPNNAPPPATGKPRTWTITTDTGFSISGHLPSWAADNPGEHRLPVDRTGPDDITELAATFRAHADLLDHHVRPALLRARLDWQLHGTLPPAAAGHGTSAS
ncbi:hypothetical protein RVR_4243 [Actinacidiphila reveromycinica]|uniref:Uncharacterized protein n=1 Tax=Actinacidiphila reveromycinica TaxID=659352 RepID=A0A7U3UT55_9ACTN|nr:hypothetical protein [Streptomyces sp. SN-593]BBA98163.1 hypothetical protein RVR_4243 [Streptomyces sp. SN-593]